jgi:hypothetical protein
VTGDCHAGIPWEPGAAMTPGHPTFSRKCSFLALVTIFLVLGFSMVTIGVAYLLAGIAPFAYDVTMTVRSKDVALVLPS